MSERVDFQTSDGVKIVGDYYVPEGVQLGAVVLLHMMPADRTSWSDFAQKLATAGFTVLAIDLRGHGESVVQETREEKLDYTQFSDEEHQKSILDVDAAVAYIQKRDSAGKLFLAGASIGANLALQYTAEHSEVRGAILLSAGLNYKGIETIPFAKKLKVDQNIYVVASRDDPNVPENAEQSQKIHESIVSKKARLDSTVKSRQAIKTFETGGHGTDILEVHSEFQEELINWLISL